MTELRKYPYRPDIDGLRAVAVIAVVIHHLSESLIPGGFVGVDVFFVISGFVVTQSILRTQTGHVLNDLLGFWRRRWLRIIPAVLFMIAVTSVIFSVFFAPIPLETYNGTLRTGLASAFGLSNMYLLRLTTDYFQADQSINVFLHTWSLGVEEQFYVVFSLLVIAVPGLLADRGKARLLRSMVLAVFLVISFWIFLELAESKPMSAYYLLPARFWEMALGSVIAFSFGRLAVLRPPSWLLNGIQIAGVALLLIALFFYPDPDFRFATPIILATGASAIFIVAGTVRQPGRFGNLVTAFLSLRVLVFVGLLSYSIYLWHWPIIILFRYMIGLDSVIAVTSALSLILLISLFSFHFVEQKWRKSTAPFLKRLAPGFAVAFGIVFFSTALPQLFPGKIYAGTSQAWKTDWRPEHNYAYGDVGKIKAPDCSLVAGSQIPDHLPEKCISKRVVNHETTNETLGSSDLPVLGKLILVGDSHSFANWPMASYGRQAGAFDMAAFGHDGCHPFGPVIKKSPSCQEYLRSLPEILERDLNQGDAILVSLFMPFDIPGPYPGAEDFISRLAKVAKRTGTKLIIEAPLPRFSRPAYLCMPEWFRLDYRGCEVSSPNYESSRLYVRSWIAGLLQNYENVIYVWDPVDLLCKEERCFQFSAGKPIFRDSNHLSYFGSFSLGAEFIQFLKSIGNQNNNQRIVEP